MKTIHQIKHLRHTLRGGSLALALLMLAAGCRGSGDGADKPATSGSAGQASTSQASAAAGSGQAGGAAAGGTAASATRWQRTVKPEPSPAAKVLYRRAVDQLAADNPVAAAPLLAQVRRDHADSRFGARLDAPDAQFGAAFGALVAATAGLAAASGLWGLRKEKPAEPVPAVPASKP